MVRDPWIQTNSALKLHVLNPRAEEIYITDIARGLANTCRWAAQTTEFYSVAQHSVLLSLAVPSDLKLAALLHDAHEAYLGDLPSPLKSNTALGLEYVLIADRLQEVIEEKYNIEPMESRLAIWDARIAVTEARSLGMDHFSSDPGWGLSVEPLALSIHPWTAENSYHAFLKRFYDLTRKQEAEVEMASSNLHGD